MMAKVEVNGAQAHPVYQVGRREGSSAGGITVWRELCLVMATQPAHPHQSLNHPLSMCSHCPSLPLTAAPLHAQYLKSEKKQMFMELIKWNFEK